MIKISDAIAKYLVDVGVKYVFGFQGGSVTHLIDSISKMNGIEYIQNYHEQGASFSADAYARVSKEGLGVAIATNGPGATNLITGIANAYCDSVPILFLTGQVHTYAMKGNSGYRQESFQEIDILSIVKPITKFCVTVVNKNDVIPCIKEAIKLAKCGRPGPVLVDLPIDIQGEEIEEYAFTNFEGDCLINQSKERYPGVKKQVESAVQILLSSHRPVFLCGGGMKQDGKLILERLSEKYNIPVVCSLMGLDVIDHNLDNFIGFIGVYGNRYANITLQNADLLIVLGSRLDLRQTGKNRREFARNAKIIHIDIDPLELEHIKKEELSILCDSTFFLREFESILDRNSITINFLDWIEKAKGWKQKYPSTDELRTNGINPNRFMEKLGMSLSENIVVCADVGQNQMWLAQSLRVACKNFRILNSGGLGAMGYSLPACIGAFYGRPGSKCIAVMGDGGLQMNIQELQLIGSRKLPLTVIVMNNHSLGMIKDVHDKYYKSNYEGSVRGFSCPSLEKIASAYELNYIRIKDESELSNISIAINSKLPILVEVELLQDTHIAPELIGMNSLDNQMPERRECQQLQEVQ